MSKSVSFTASSLEARLDLYQSQLGKVRSAVSSLNTLENQLRQSKDQILSNPATLMRFQGALDSCRLQFEQIGDLTQNQALQEITEFALSKLGALQALSTIGALQAQAAPPVTLHLPAPAPATPETLLRGIAAQFNAHQSAEALEQFSRFEAQHQELANRVYGNLWKIKGSPIGVHHDFGRAAFHHRDGLSSEDSERAQAILPLCPAAESRSPSPRTIQFLPATLLHLVSTFLTPSELGSSFQVCKEWGADKRDNNIWRSQLERWGRAKWKMCLGDPGEVPPLPANILEILHSECPWAHRPLRECYLLTLVPATVTYTCGVSRQIERCEPLTLNLLDTLVRSSPRGNRNGFNRYSAVPHPLKIEPVAQSHWVLLSKELVPDSWHDRYKDQMIYVDKHGFQVPMVLDAAVAIFLHKLMWKGALLAEAGMSTMLTHCEETDAAYQSELSMGAFSDEGLNIVDWSGADELMHNDARSDSRNPGIAPMKRL